MTMHHPCRGDSLRDCEQAFQAVVVMHEKGLPLSAQLFTSLLRKCTCEEYLSLGRRVQELLLTMRRGGSSPTFYNFIANHLIRMFALCGSLADANQVFASLRTPNAHAWSALIFAHTKFGQDDHAIHLFCTMLLHSNVYPDAPVFVAVLKACSNAQHFIQGKIIHSEVAAHALESNPHVGSSLVAIYAKYGSLKDARNVFDSLPAQSTVTWGALISGYVLHHHGREALHAFRQMLGHGIPPDNITLVNMLKASVDIKDAKQSKVFHSYINEWSFDSNLMVANALVDMYSSYGSIKSARKIFDTMLKHDVVTWASMIGGYTQQGLGEEALLLYQQMQHEGTEPNSVTFVFLINVCSNLSLMPSGKLIHNHIVQRDCEESEHVGNALVEMYSKSGSIEDAYHVFHVLPKRDLVAWNSMIAGFAKYGDYKHAKLSYEQMTEQGLRPNIITFISLLSACGLQGLVQEGCATFNLLMEHPHIIPESDVYSCMVNILGRAGFLLEAEDLVQTMAYQPNMITWMCLLGQCRMHGNVEMGGESFEHVVVNADGDYRHASGYALMVDMYARAGMQRDQEGMQHLRISANAWKRPAGARIMIAGDTHDFIVGDEAHTQRAEIYAELKRLQVRVRKSGYVCMYVP